MNDTLVVDLAVIFGDIAFARLTNVLSQALFGKALFREVWNRNVLELAIEKALIASKMGKMTEKNVVALSQLLKFGYISEKTFRCLSDTIKSRIEDKLKWEWCFDASELKWGIMPQ